MSFLLVLSQSRCFVCVPPSTTQGTPSITTLQAQIRGYCAQWKGFSFSTPSSKRQPDMLVSCLLLSFVRVPQLVMARPPPVSRSAAAARRDGAAYLISVSLPVVIGSCERGDFNHRRTLCVWQEGRRWHLTEAASQNWWPAHVPAAACCIMRSISDGWCVGGFRPVFTCCPGEENKRIQWTH